MEQTICASCVKSIRDDKETGYSSLYNPSGPEILLCMPCWNIENSLVDEEGNDLPELLKKYKKNLGLV